MTVAIVQARMTSKRFPGKVVAPLLGKPVLQHVLERVKKIGVAKVICAFPEDPRSAPILKICRDMHVIAFAGPELDVLERYYLAAESVGADRIMRITADCPFLCPKTCDDVLSLSVKEDLDYCSNVYPERSFPRGLDCEVFTFDALEAAHLNAEDPLYREHVTTWMQRTPGLNIGTVKSKEDNGKLNYCVDYPFDIQRLEAIWTEANE